MFYVHDISAATKQTERREKRICLVFVDRKNFKFAKKQQDLSAFKRRNFVNQDQDDTAWPNVSKKL